MLKAELYKLFFKHRLIYITGAFLILHTLLSVSFQIPSINTAVHSEEFSCGYAVFLNRDNVNWLLIAVIVYAVIITWIYEYTSEMQIYNLTSQNGRVRLAINKLLILILFISFCSITADGISVICYNLKAGNNIISLSGCGMDFSSSVRDISSQQAVFTASVIHIFGYTIFTVQCTFLSIIIKNVVSFGGVAFILLTLPVYFFDDISERLRMPFAVSLMQGASMLRGDIMDSADNSRYLFKALTDSEIISCILFQSLIALILSVISVMLFSGIQIRLKKIAVFSLIFSLLCISGCSNNVTTANRNEYFAIDGTNSVYNKNTGEIISVNPTPFSNKNLVHLADNKAIVWENCKNTFSTYQIKAVDIESLCETVILTIGNSVNQNGFLGLDTLVEIPSSLLWDENFMLSRDFILSDNIVYFFHPEKIICYDTRNGRKCEQYACSSYSNPLIVKGDIYYLNDKGRLCKNHKKMTDNVVSAYLANENGVCYKEDGDSLIIVSDNKTTEYKCGFVGRIFYFDEDLIIYEGEKGSVVNRNGVESFYPMWAVHADEENLYCFDDKEILEIKY